MSPMSRFFAQKIIRYRWPLFLTVLAITTVFAYHLKNIALDERLTDIAPEGHPYVRLSRYMTQVFGGHAMVQIAMEVKEGDVFDRGALAKLSRIQERLERLRDVVPGGVVSIVSRKLKHIYSSTDEYGYSVLNVESLKDMVERALDGDEKDAVAYRRVLLNDESINGPIVSRDKKSTIIHAQFFSGRDYLYLFRNIQDIVKKEEDSNTRFYLSGNSIAMGHLSTYMKGMIVLFAVAIGITMVLLLLAFGTVRGVVIPLWAGLVTVVWGLGSEALLGLKIDIMSIIVPFMIMAIEVSHSVQILNRYYEEFDRCRDNRKAVEEALGHLFVPGLSSIVTDGAGFATLLFVPFRLIQVMAGLATYGVLRILITTIVFLPALLAILPPPSEKELARVRRRGHWLGIVLERIALISYRRKGLVGGFAFVFLAIGLVGLSRVEVGEMQPGSPIFWQDSEYNRAEVVNNRFTGTNPYLLYLEGQREFDLWDPEVVRKVHLLQQYLEEKKDVGGGRSYVDVLIRMNRVSHDNDPRWEILPRNRGIIGEFLSRFSQSGGPETAKGYFEIDFREGTLTLFVKDHRGRTIREIIGETEAFLANSHDNLCVDIRLAAGTIGVYAAIMDEIKRGQVGNLLMISTAIFLFCLLTFRSFLAAFMIILTLGLGCIITYAAMGYGKIGLFVYTLPIASLGMGIGVDYAIYVVSRLKEEMSSEADAEKAWVKAMATSGRGIFYTAMSVAIGMATLLLSPIRFQAMMGGMLTVVTFANMLGALFILPTLIAWLRPRFLRTGE